MREHILTQKRSMLTSRDVPINPWIHARWFIAAIGEMTQKTDCRPIIDGFVKTSLKYLGIKSKLIVSVYELMLYFIVITKNILGPKTFTS